MFMMKPHAIKVYGIADTKHGRFSKSALHEYRMYLHVSMSLTLKAINRSLEDSDSDWASGGNTNSCDFTMNMLFIHSFHWRVQNSTIPCRSQELLPFLSIIYFFLPPFSINYSSILSHLILPSISWPTSQSCCSQIHL